MAFVNLDIAKLQTQFYSKAVSFNNFKDVTKEDIERILTSVKIRQKRATENKSVFHNNEIAFYANTLKYLISPRICFELKTIDERILFLILSTDPELKTYTSFLGSEIVPLEDIKTASKEEAPILTDQRNEAISELEQEVRASIGFYDQHFIKYESILSKGLLKNKGFIENVRIPSIRSITRKADQLENIENLNQLSVGRMKNLRDRWYTEAKNPSDFNSLAYNILNNSRELRLFTKEEQVLLFTLIADPDLNLLRIFEEECTQKRIIERALSEVGFYSQGMLRFEKLYHSKFEPEKQISAWTK